MKVIIVKGKKELLVAIKESFAFDGVTTIILLRKGGDTTEYKIYSPLKCFEETFKQVVRNINRTHSKCFV